MVRRPATRKRKPVLKSDVEQIAALYVKARTLLVRAGRALHDDVGSSLAAVGVQLQLLRMDVPSAQARIDETLGILEATFTRIRDLSQELCPSPVYRGGLKQALLRLAEHHDSQGCHIAVKYFSTAAIPPVIAAALYEAGCAALEQALRQGATRVDIAVRGNGRPVLRVTDDGRKSGRARALAAIGGIAREQGLAFACVTGKSTIVSIRYALRRPAGG